MILCEMLIYGTMKSESLGTPFDTSIEVNQLKEWKGSMREDGNTNQMVFSTLDFIFSILFI